MKLPSCGALVARLHDDDDSCAVDIGLAFILHDKNGYNCLELRQDGEASFFDYPYDTIYTENINPLREFVRDFSGDWKILWKRN